MAAKKSVAVRGSKKVSLAGAKAIAPAPHDERLEVTIRLRPGKPLPDASAWLNPAAELPAILSHGEFETRYGADPKDFTRVRKFAKEHNLTVVRESPARRSVMLSGTVADFQEAFGVDLKIYEHPGGTYRGRIGSVHVPAELGEIVEGVFGLDNRPVATTHFRRIARDTQAARPAAAAAGARPFDPTELAAIYDFPPKLDGSGQCIGIIELGGGYRPQDLQTYFKRLGVGNPTVVPVSVDGGSNTPVGDPNSDDGEVVLDIEVAGAVAPGAKLAVYFAADASGKSFLDAITKAVHDTTNNPSVISISWGGPEQFPTSNFQTQFNQALQAAAMLGITVCVAAGDNGAADMGPNAWDGQAHADFPASSPFALACGGTRLIAGPGGSIKSESVWNQHFADTSMNAGPAGSFGSTGGGVSGVFALPAYQKKAGVPPSLNPAGFKGRGLPDVTGAGDPATGYNITVDGTDTAFGGTSAVAPLWAGLIARINQGLNGRVGFINPQLYAVSASSGVFHDVTDDNNRVSFGGNNNVGYDAGPGWDACSGLGSSDGAKLMGVLTAGTPAPSPAVASNGAVPRAAKARTSAKAKKKALATPEAPQGAARMKTSWAAKTPPKLKKLPK